MSNTTTFKTRATRSTRGEIWCITVDLFDDNPHPADVGRNAARLEIKDRWEDTKTTWTLRDISPSALLFLAEELEAFGDPNAGWCSEVMQTRRAFPRLARELREHVEGLTD